MIDPFKNIYADPIHVSFDELVYVDDESIYRWQCPVCESGLLLMSRDMNTMGLRKEDRCTSCGQWVIYTDTLTEENMIEVARRKNHPIFRNKNPRTPRNH